MYKNQYLKGTSALLTSLLVLGMVEMPTPVLAQDSNEAVLEEILVTSRRYEESAQDAPVSVNVITADYFEKQRIETVDDIIQLTPGASFIRFNKLQAEYNIRGINANAEGSSVEAAVVTVIDNIPISKDFMKNPAMFDIARVEVLRGPQGTSFGRNASAGLVHIITQRPSQETSGRISVGAGSHELIEADGYINGALSETISARLAFNFDTYDGYTESISTGEGLDGQKNFALRGSLLFEPSDNLSVYLKAEYNKDDDETSVRRSRDCTLPTLDASAGPPHPNWPNVFTDPCDVWKTEISDGDFFIKREILNFTGEIVYEFGNGLTLTSETGYLDGSTDRLQEAHGTPQNVLWQRGMSDASAFSQELRLDNHASDAAFRWLAGVYYLTDEHDKFDENQFFQNGAAGRPDTRDTKISRNESDSIGLFGEVTYDVSDRLTVTGGVRWTKDDKDYQIAHTAFGWGGPINGISDFNDANMCIFNPGPPGPTTNFICGDAANPTGFATPVSVSNSWEDVAFKGSASYRVNDDHVVYALISQGYKAGGFQPEPLNPTLAQDSFSEETSTSYELGWKGEINGRARFSIAAYYLEYNDLQLSQFLTLTEDIDGDGIPEVLGFTQAIGTAGGAESFGFEAEATILLTSDFRISGSLAILDTKLTNTFLDTDGDGIDEDFSGFRPDNAAKWTATFNAEYDFHLSGGSTVTLRADYRGRSSIWDDIINRTDTVDTRLRPSADVFGARITWLSEDETISASLWGKNLFEEEEILNIGPPQPNTLQLPTAFGAPRTIGGSVSYRF